VSGGNSLKGLPKDFVDYVFRRRKDSVLKMVEGGFTDKEIFLEFTRTTPAVITYGPAGLSGSIKMVGFIPKADSISKAIEDIRELFRQKPSMPFKEFMAKFVSMIYDEDIVDLKRFGGLEMAFRHSWNNIKANGKATLLFYTPPTTSYEVRCSVKIHEGDEVHEYLNLLHDVFHTPDTGRSEYPAYEFIINEIYDQSATPRGFGKLIYKA
jgi:hypothetical protein